MLVRSPRGPRWVEVRAARFAPVTQDGTSGKSIGVRFVALGVLGLTLAAAIVRFATLDAQSYWFDEALTVNLTHGSFGDMLDGIRAHEANPPLYYTLARFWSRLFGDGEVGLRSLSALAGTLTVPVAYAAGNSLVDRRTGLIVATLAAFSPALVWYSQEARAYALLVFFCALSLLFFAQARAHGRPASFAAWALTSALALWTHYFAVFLLAPEAVLLLAQAERRRAAIAAIAVVVAAGALVAPLALDQRTNGGGGWIAGGNFVGRAVNVPFFFAGGVGSHRLGFLLVVAVGLASAAALYAVWRAPAGEWRAGALV